MSAMTRTAWGLDSPRDEWRGHTLCNPTNAHLFELTDSNSARPRLSEDNRAALWLCRRCPVQAECLAEWRQVDPARRRSTIAGAVVWDKYGQQASA